MVYNTDNYWVSGLRPSSGVLNTRKHDVLKTSIFRYVVFSCDRLCGLVVRVLGYRFGGPGSIPGTSRFSGKKRKKKKASSGSGTGSTQPREYN
jgi:hypothetical protein